VALTNLALYGMIDRLVDFVILWYHGYIVGQINPIVYFYRVKTS
jgi:hypothetical protein